MHSPTLDRRVSCGALLTIPVVLTIMTALSLSQLIGFLTSRAFKLSHLRLLSQLKSRFLEVSGLDVDADANIG